MRNLVVRRMMVATLMLASPVLAQPAEKVKPMPAPAKPELVKPAPTMTEPSKPAPPSGIEGAYRVSDGTEQIWVKRLLGDIYYLRSSEGWEGTGILDGTIYHGVLHYPGERDAKTKGVLGQHAIDWSTLDSPSVHVTYTGGRTGEFDQRWARGEGTPDRAADKGRGGVVPMPPRPEPPTVAVPPERLPDFGEYVYVEVLPEAITKVSPIYPDEAKRAGVEGTVMVQALVLKDGTVGDTRVVKSIPLLDPAAVAAVRQWHFKPASSKGEPVAVWVAVPVRFPPQ